MSETISHKLLWISDLHFTGYSTVAKFFISQFINDSNYEVSVLAVNHNLDPEQLISNIRGCFPQLKNIWCIQPALFTNINGVYSVHDASLCRIFGIYDLQRISKNYQPNTIFILNDINPCRLYLRTKSLFPKTKFIAYMPIDGGNNPIGIFDELRIYDKILTMTHFASDEFLRCSKIHASILYHPLNQDIFHPLEQNKLDLRKKWLQDFSHIHDSYIILNVNANQQRKRLDLTIKIFAKFNAKVPNSALILKTKNKTSDIGAERGVIDLTDYIKENYPKLLSRIIILDLMLSPEDLNEIYNMADVFITTTLGEGWGYTPCEALLAGCRVLVPNHTSFQELFSSEQMYRSTPIPWITRVPEFKPNPFSLYLYALLVKNSHNLPDKHHWAKKSLENDDNLPVISISQLGIDSEPSGIADIDPITGKLSLAHFKSLKFAKNYLSRFLPNSDYVAVQIQIQTGTNFEHWKRELANVGNEEIIVKNYNVYQLDVHTIIQQIAECYLPDIDNCLEKLMKIYLEKIQTEKIVQKRREWLIEKCDGKKLYQQLLEYIK